MLKFKFTHDFGITANLYYQNQNKSHFCLIYVFFNYFLDIDSYILVI